MNPCTSCNGTGECVACVDADSYACNACMCTGECPDCDGPSEHIDPRQQPTTSQLQKCGSTPDNPRCTVSKNAICEKHH